MNVTERRGLALDQSGLQDGFECCKLRVWLEPIRDLSVATNGRDFNLSCLQILQ